MKISVIIPCYNSQLYVGECIESVINQTYENFEIICINDGSIDNTLNELNKYKSLYPEKIKIITTTNIGASAARNLGLIYSTGEIIQFLDSDDILINNKFETQIKGFDSLETEMVVSDWEKKDFSLTETKETIFLSEITENPLETAITKIIITGNPLYRKGIIEKVGGYTDNLKSSQDWDFHIKLILNGINLEYISGVLFLHRAVKESVSSDWNKVIKSACEVIINRKNEISESIFFNPKIATFLFSLFFDAALFSCKKEETERYIQEAENWYSKSLNRNKTIKSYLIFFIGISFTIKIYRLLRR
jgi:glycosyltransferase involved in cell wall biosynthesis